MLYHIVPPDLKGDTLYPLNTLKTEYPEMYKNLIPKYEGREQVLKQRISLLECLWNDVLHLSPIHPLDLKEAHEKAGIPWTSRSFFEIDAEEAGISPSNAVFWTDRWVIKEEIPQIEPEVRAFSSQLLPSLSHIPNATRHHYERCAQQGTAPFTFAFVPHILFKGSLIVEGLRVIEVS